MINIFENNLDLQKIQYNLPYKSKILTETSTKMSYRPVSAMSRHEIDLINKSKRALASGELEDSVEKLRLMCLARGASGIMGLGR